jgi:hypothetical protein
MDARLSLHRNVEREKSEEVYCTDAETLGNILGSRDCTPNATDMSCEASGGSLHQSCPRGITKSQV